MNMSKEDIVSCFNELAEYAKNHSTCLKVAVGAMFITNDGRKFYTANNGKVNNCRENGFCHKANVTGVYESVEWTRKYCSATHAEINMINLLRSENIDPANGVLLVLRYPCENCAKKTSKFGFKKILYCGRQEISDTVKEIYSGHGVDVTWYPDLDYEF